jgi:hypothetical protein
MTVDTGSKPVVVMETGYPAAPPGSTDLPAAFNFTETAQAEYYKKSFQGAVGAGAVGMLRCGL